MSERTMKEFLDHASEQYYNGTPIISDAEFDKLAQIHDYDTVGYSVTDGTPHYFEMYSLQKFFSVADCPASSEDEGWIGSPKLDGAAISVLYLNGRFEHALTRGDGKLGKDITDKIAYLVPETILSPHSALQITGEIVAPKTEPNARNLAAGSLNLKSVKEFLDRIGEKKLSFLTYDAQPNLHALWSMSLKKLSEFGFKTVLGENWDKIYPTDGEVYRINRYENFEKMGYTSHHPRGAFALKEQKEGVVTKLLSVSWQIGKSGIVSPVALLEPVMIGDAMVSRATLHNIEYIRGLNLEIGCDVEVIRSGEIIPRILRRVEKK